MTRSELRAAIAKLEKREVARLAMPPLDATASAARIVALLAVADPAAPMTSENRRACRVLELMNIARQRRDAARSTEES